MQIHLWQYCATNYTFLTCHNVRQESETDNNYVSRRNARRTLNKDNVSSSSRYTSYIDLAVCNLSIIWRWSYLREPPIHSGVGPTFSAAAFSALIEFCRWRRRHKKKSGGGGAIVAAQTSSFLTAL